MTKSGKVWLVGAGPGDPELLTIKAARVLGKADVLLVDDLVNRAILVHAREDARVVYVGKRGGCKSTPQAFIERLMIAEAKAGRAVVRLKGGDPCIFGRGGEELEALARAGIECEIVNGVTAGLAAAGSLGVSLTHRDASQGVIFVTAHASGDDEPDWAALAKARMTLVVYMGIARCAQLQQSLMDAGLARETPVLIVESASQPQERRLPARLENLAVAVEQQDVRSPAILVIGQVASAQPAYEHSGLGRLAESGTRRTD